MKKITLALLSIFMLSSCSSAVSFNSVNDGDIITAKISGQTFDFLTVKSPQARAKGLSGRTELPENGMIFFFEWPQALTFWMKDMHFAIDIVWVKDNKVVGISRDLKPQPEAEDKDLNIYSSFALANIAIELNAGDAKKYNIEPGQKIKFKRNK